MQKLYGGGSFGKAGEIYDAQYGDQYDTMSPQFLYGVYKQMQNPDGSYYYDYEMDENWGARYDASVMMASALYYDPTSVKYGIADPYVHQLDLADLFRTGTTNTTNVAFSKARSDYNTRISFTNSERSSIQQYHSSDLTVQGRLTWGDRFIDDLLSLDAAAFIEERQYHYKNLDGNRFYYYWYSKAEVGKPIGLLTTMSRWKCDENGNYIVKPTTSEA